MALCSNRCMAKFTCTFKDPDHSRELDCDVLIVFDTVTHTRWSDQAVKAICAKFIEFVPVKGDN